MDRLNLNFRQLLQGEVGWRLISIVLASAFLIIVILLATGLLWEVASCLAIPITVALALFLAIILFQLIQSRLTGEQPTKIALSIKYKVVFATIFFIFFFVLSVLLLTQQREPPASQSIPLITPSLLPGAVSQTAFTYELQRSAPVETATPIVTPSLTSTSTVRPTRTPMPTLTPSPTWTPPPVPKVVIADIVYDPGADDFRRLDEEYVVLVNFIGAVHLAEWILSDSQGNTYVFPNVALNKGTVLRVHSGQGVDTATELYWGRKTPIWDNEGDVATLRDDAGAIIDTFSYGGP